MRELIPIIISGFVMMPRVRTTTRKYAKPTVEAVVGVQQTVKI